ncbi:ATP-dependent helicase [Acaricomes phytoseiuli]|uniref:ATP-dependent DNA helicase n=1 Tax=Acaricomes phytoseiuli TaxID=291968 RepID=UPI000365E6F0|nr:ATP-dependent DNA helicase [Acaricomes phytoseiuli]MCW1249011.1 ATP-dependent helicase [Acaricomes phytoseiuli]
MKPQPTPEQQAVIEAPLQPMLVIAGAGSGKTTTMADRVAHLVASGQVRAEEVLGITFTRKAAGELASRIRQKLRLSGKAEPATSESMLSAARGGDPAELLEPTVATYHSYANSLVSEYGLRLGVERDAVVMGQAQSWQLASRIVESYDGDLSGYSGSLDTLVRAVIAMAGESAEHLRAPEEVSAWLTRFADQFGALPHRTGPGRDAPGKAVKLDALLRQRAQVADLVARYQRAKTQRNLLDFGDLVALAARLAQEIPAVGRAEREKYRVVLLDEFQDTSYAQLALFAALFSDGHPVTAVGDPHQSIYGFRGASAGQLFQFPQTFRTVTGEPAPVLALTVAWRNSLAVLEAANTMSEPLTRAAQQRDDAGTWRNSLAPLQPNPWAAAGEVELARYATEAEEAEAVAERILARAAGRVQQIRDPADTTPAQTSSAQASSAQTSVAVLCRRRSQIPAIQQALEERGIPYEVAGLGGLLATPEVIDLVSTLRVISDPSRSDALMRLLSGARWRIGPRDLMALADFAQSLGSARRQRTAPGESAESELADQSDAVSLVEALDALEGSSWPRHDAVRPLSDAGRERLLTLAAELRELRRFLGDDLLATIIEAERAIGLDIELAARPGREFHQARQHLDAFQEVAAVFLHSAENVDLAAFLAWLSIAEDEEGGLEPLAVEPMPGAVQLLTVHAAKGLEWDEVYVPGLAAQSFPSDRVPRWTSGAASLPWPLRGDRADLPQWQPDQLPESDQKSWLASLAEFEEAAAEHAVTEERRLAYVAFTRARQYLMLSCAAWVGTAATLREPSPFLTELVERKQPPSRFRVRHWSAEGDIPEENPARSLPIRAEWPYDPLAGPRLSRGDQVQQPGPGRRRALEAAAQRVGRVGQQNAGMALEELVAQSPRWGAEVQRLLERRNPEEHLDVQLPGHLSASALVDLSAEPEKMIAQLRRPVPREPGVQARVGTAFHGWVEQFYAKTGQLDLDEIPAADDELDAGLDLPGLQETFRNSVWAAQLPETVEVPVETRIGGIVARGRIDAVFPRDGGGWCVVDWKTGRVPHPGEEARHRAVQLAVYRLAWARLRGIPVSDVSAAFYYVQQDRTVWLEELAEDLARAGDESGLVEILERAYQA